jgi:hypothetical protein
VAWSAFATSRLPSIDVATLGETALNRLSWIQFRQGDTVRYVGHQREVGISIIPGTMGSIVTGPVARCLSPGGPQRLACQVLFGYRTIWIPVERLEVEGSN